MNLILLFDSDFLDDRVARVTGRRFRHVIDVLHPAIGDTLAAGIAGGGIGRGEVVAIGENALDLRVTIDTEPPAPLPLTLVLALPRPKVLNRVIAAASSLGVKSIYLVNAWKVEKSYWKSPRMSEANLRDQSILGLEQARDTMLPSIETRRLFRPFVEDELPSIVSGTVALVPHPGAVEPCPRELPGPVTLAIGPEGGFIPEEIASLERAGFRPVSLGARILRVETAIATAIGRLFDGRL